ncbi:MAG TPA: iron ABC transporter permease [Pseudonocardiaceae bacterium]
MKAAREARPAPLAAAGLGVVVPVLVVALVLVMLVAACVGSVTVPLAETWRVIAGHVTGDLSGVDPAYDQIVWRYRVPRVILAALCGAGLAVAGVVLQAVVNNPLADPYVLGLSSGASLGAVLVITAGAGAIGGLGVTLAAFLGAMAAIVLVFLLGQQGGQVLPTRLVLAGVAIGYLLLACTSYLQLRANPNELRQVMFWLLGSVAGATWDQLRVVTLVVCLSIAVLLLFGRRLNALATGDEQATALGVDVRTLRIGMLVASSLLTGVLIAVAGGVGFVGLMIPHLVRLAFGVDHRRVLPLAVLVGAVYLVAVDLLSRSVDPPNELPLGIFTAAFGAPFFLWLLRRDSTLGAG